MANGLFYGFFAFYPITSFSIVLKCVKARYTIGANNQTLYAKIYKAKLLGHCV